MFHRLLLGLALLGAACTAEDQATEGAGNSEGLVIVNDDPADPERLYFFDVGTLKHGERRKLNVDFRNAESDPVTFKQVDPACSCTSASKLLLIDAEGNTLEEGDLRRRGDMLTVPPGGMARLVVGVNTSSVVPNKQKLAIMRLQTTSKVTAFITLEIRVASKRPFTVNPDSIQLGHVPTAHGGSARVEVMTAHKGSDERVLDIQSTSAPFTAEMEYLFINEEHIWTVVATLPPGESLGPKAGEVVLETIDDQGNPDTLAIKVWAQVVHDVGFDRPDPHFGPVLPGEAKELVFELVARVPGLRVKVDDVSLVGENTDHLSVEFLPSPGYVDDTGHSRRWTIKVLTTGEHPPGRFEAQLTAHLTDDQYPEIVTKIQGVVRDLSPKDG